MKYSRVNLKLLAPGKYLMRYTDNSGRDVRERISVSTAKQARKIADAVLEQLLATKGRLGARALVPSIKRGILDAIDNSRGSLRHRVDMENRAAFFTKWLADNFPEARSWNDLRPSMLVQYQRAIEDELAPDSVRLRLAPIRQAWRMMHLDYPDQVAPCPDVKIERPRAVEPQAFSPVELESFLRFLNRTAPALYGMAILQAFVGLSEMEAAGMGANDVTSEDKQVTVRVRRAKNKYRPRLLPIACGAGELIVASPPPFLNMRGSAWTVTALGTAWGRAYDRASKRRRMIQPHRLRATFATMARAGGADRDLIKAYMGHSPRDVLGLHYEVISAEQLLTVSEAAFKYYLANIRHMVTQAI